MLLSAYIPTLLELALVKISIGLWSQSSLREYTRRDLNGHVHIEKALPIIKKSISALGVRLPVKIKKLLSDMSERVGYEIRSFMIQSVLNSTRIECLKNDYNFVDLNLSRDLQWTSGGEISSEKTLTMFMINHPKASPLLCFLAACETGNESLILKVWKKLSVDQILQIESRLSWTEKDAFAAYWICYCQNQLEVFFKNYESKNFVISSKGSVFLYLVMHSMKTCFKSRTRYFYSKLDKIEKEKFTQVIDINGRNPLLLGRIKYSFKFFEAPILNHQANKLVLENLSEDEFEYYVDYLFSETNDLSELHTNVLLYVMSIASEDLKLWTLKDPDFHFFLISKGRFYVVEMLINDEIKNVLKKEIMTDWNLGTVSPALEMALASEYSDDLEKFIEMIAENDNKISTCSFLEGLKSFCQLKI